MGFYLPGIGEALGAGLRARAINEQMASVKDIIASDRPWSEKRVLITQANPELVNTPEFQKIDAANARAELLGYEADKAKKEKLETDSQAQFKDTVSKLPPAQREGYLKANRTMAQKVFPEEYGVIEDAEAAATRQKEWDREWDIRRKAELQDQATQRANTVADRTADNAAEIAKDIATGVRNPDGSFVTPEQKNKAALDQAAAKQKQTADIEAGIASEGKVKDTESYLTDLENYTRTVANASSFPAGAEAGTIASMHSNLSNKKARVLAGGKTTESDEEVARKIIPLWDTTATRGSTMGALLTEVNATRRELGLPEVTAEAFAPKPKGQLKRVR